MVGHPLLTARAFKALAITPGGCFMHGTQCKLCRGAAIMDMIPKLRLTGKSILACYSKCRNGLRKEPLIQTSIAGILPCH